LEWFGDLGGKQQHDPARVAAAIIEALDSAEPPLRSPSVKRRLRRSGRSSTASERTSRPERAS
jgi:hypothetical protein